MLIHGQKIRSKKNENRKGNGKEKDNRKKMMNQSGRSFSVKQFLLFLFENRL